MAVSKKKVARVKGTTTKKSPSLKDASKQKSDFIPFFAGEETIASVTSSTSTRTRRNRAATTNIIESDRYPNIKNVPYPYSSSTDGVDVKTAIDLCQKAYWGFPLLRNTIDVMTELSNSPIYLKGGTKKSRDFLSRWLRKIKIWKLKDQFFREYYRSGNVFLYRLDGKFSEEDVKKMNQIYGQEVRDLPLRYILLNPKDIKAEHSSSFDSSFQFVKILNGYEIERLRNPKTDEDKKIFESLTPQQKANIRSGRPATISVDKKRLYAAFYKKQDYEPLSVPMAFSVLESIESKMELQKIDMQIARTADWMILLITMGAKPEEGGINSNNIRAMQALIANESVKRTLVADYTTKGEWLIPDISKILNKEKYAQINEDILQGLNSVLFSSNEKFANTHIKVQVFIERLKEARQAFVEEFLQDEVKRVSEIMGFKSFPTVHFEEISLKDESALMRIYTQLASLGVLTPEETIESIETGKLPTPEESLESQRKFKELKEEGLYSPIMSSSSGGTEGGEDEDPESNQGRPSGINTPQSTKNVSPIGDGPQNSSTLGYSMNLMQGVIKAADELETKLENALRKRFKIKKGSELTQDQQGIIENLLFNIMTNEDKKSWVSHIKNYIDSPKPMNPEKANDIDEIAAKHGLSTRESVILFLSKKEE